MRPGPARAAPRLYTIGHSTRPLDQLVALLEEHGVTHLVDVRSVPRSRRHPHFSREALAGSLPERGIAYTHLPGLGGLRKPRPDSINAGWRVAGFRGFADYMETAAFEESLGVLLELASRQTTAIMCAEAVPWRCHRTLISDAIVARGVAVEHILEARSLRAHTLTPWARIEAGRISYPGPQRALPIDRGDEAQDR